MDLFKSTNGSFGVLQKAGKQIKGKPGLFLTMTSKGKRWKRLVGKEESPEKKWAKEHAYPFKPETIKEIISDKIKKMPIKEAKQLITDILGVLTTAAVWTKSDQEIYDIVKPVALDIIKAGKQIKGRPGIYLDPAAHRYKQTQKKIGTAGDKMTGTEKQIKYANDLIDQNTKKINDRISELKKDIVYYTNKPGTSETRERVINEMRNSLIRAEKCLTYVNAARKRNAGQVISALASGSKFITAYILDGPTEYNGKKIISVGFKNIKDLAA